ncbi:MAG: hypothetical protein IPP37_07415 [Saprospiraceae bacterium]|nr:hypothetical protein [Saprospiraceae bacterium]
MDVEQGGNCEASELNKVVVKHGVKTAWSRQPAINARYQCQRIVCWKTSKTSCSTFLIRMVLNGKMEEEEIQ